MIHIDSREPKGLALLLNAKTGGDTNVLLLETGDYVLVDGDGCSLGVERKSVRDLLHTLSGKNAAGESRFRSQVSRLVETFDHAILLVEGVLGFNPVTGKVVVGSREFGWSHAAVQMLLWSMQYHYGASILWTDNMGATADVLRVLNDRAARGCVAPSSRWSATRAEEETRDGTD